MPDIFWLFGLMWVMSFIGVGAWWAWYALVRANQRTQHAREVQLATRQGLPPPAAPSPPNVLHFVLRISGIGALLGVAGAGVAVLTFALGNCASR
jgi:hypothetical protein